VLLAEPVAVRYREGTLHGFLAPATGQQPPDILDWILAGEVPTFLKLEGPASTGGPVWRTELATPIWPRVSAGRRGDRVSACVEPNEAAPTVLAPDV
jgi:hypothetical protein